MPLFAVLITAGFQFPVIPLGDVVAKTGAVSVLHKFRVVAKSGITSDDIITANVAIVAHCPGFGVNT
ncbi:hypothetical protein D9M71_831790 [compost metagenome]